MVCLVTWRLLTTIDGSLAVGSAAFLSAVASASGSQAAADETRWAHLRHAPGTGTPPGAPAAGTDEA